MAAFVSPIAAVAAAGAATPVVTLAPGSRSLEPDDIKALLDAISLMPEGTVANAYRRKRRQVYVNAENEEPGKAVDGYDLCKIVTAEEETDEAIWEEASTHIVNMCLTWDENKTEDHLWEMALLSEYELKEAQMPQMPQMSQMRIALGNAKEAIKTEVKARERRANTTAGVA